VHKTREHKDIKIIQNNIRLSNWHWPHYMKRAFQQQPGTTIQVSWS